MSVVKGNDSAANTANGIPLHAGRTTCCWWWMALPRGPGDVAVGGVDCSASACMYDPDPKSATYNPNLTGCNCPAVLKARSLAKDGGINVHVIAASTDLTSRNFYAAATLNNIARPAALAPASSIFRAMRPARTSCTLAELRDEGSAAVTVATTPASAASGSQTLQASRRGTCFSRHG